MATHAETLVTSTSLAAMDQGVGVTSFSRKVLS